MNRFNDILKLRSVSEKIDFIDSFNLKDGTIDEQFISNFVKKECSQSKNEWYKIKLIDLTADLKIINDNLINSYLQFVKTESFYLKLTILDYINNTYSYYNKDKIDFTVIETLLQNRHDRLIVKLQATLTLTLLFPLKKIYYLNTLKELLHRSNDYRAHIRLYNFIMGDYVNIQGSYINDFIEITNKKYFSTSVAVTNTLNELDTFLSDE